MSSLVRGVLLSAALLPCTGAALAQTARPAGWTAESHGNRSPANYALVLPDERVNEITLVFRPGDWAAVLANMTELLGKHGEETAFMRAIAGLFGRGGVSCAGGLEQEFGRVLVMDHGVDEQTLFDAAPLADSDPAAFAEAIGVTPETLQRVWLEVGNRCAGSRSRGVATIAGDPFSVPNPDWFPVEVRFGGQVWPEVGFRFKGNSSLSFGWGTGRLDLPIKLDFDEFEDEHPELKNQRFHGFKQLTFANNFQDPSLMREKLTADLFRAAGVPAAETAYYLVYLDRGDDAGAQLLGLYTAVELPDDTLIETQFEDDEGNMYKPDGQGATFAAGSFDEVSFDKETNGSSGYEDVLALFAALHDGTRRSDPAAWRAGLE
ncbi:MAG: CotH kinase family protein, partial [Anaerolineaceae bacterium]|nr:CotH kinase family protein [Anaerolineaceae bacterium]